LPTPDLIVHLAYAGAGRKALMEPRTERGRQVVARLG